MATIEQRQAALGEQGERCRDCGAPLAVDQRYCLNCGRRRAGPRLEQLQALSGHGPARPDPVAGQPPAADGGGRSRRDSPLAAVLGIAVLGVILLVGVLIGRGDDDPTTATAPPPVIRVGDQGEASSGGQADATAAKQPKDGGSQQGTQKNAADKPDQQESGGGGGGGGGGLSGGGEGSVDDPVQASTEDLEALQQQSGQDYSDASEDLPDTIATPGEAPPTDNVAPGGGSEATTIK
jgi:hypothetical protein